MTAAVKMRDLGPGLLALAIGVIFLAWSQTYTPRESAMPALVGWITIVLALIDIAAQFDTAWGRLLRRAAGMDSNDENSVADLATRPSWRWIAVAMAWVVGYGAAIYLFGLLAMTPIYIFLYMTVHGRRRFGASALSAAVITIAIWVTFEYLFHYPLYPGLLFGRN
jgi:hypothetical protein